MMHRCTCDDPKEEICHTHKTFKVSLPRYLYIRMRVLIAIRWVRFRWGMAEFFLGDQTPFQCPNCKEQFVLKRPETEVKP